MGARLPCSFLVFFCRGERLRSRCLLGSFLAFFKLSSSFPSSHALRLLSLLSYRVWVRVCLVPSLSFSVGVSVCVRAAFWVPSLRSLSSPRRFPVPTLSGF